MWGKYLFNMNSDDDIKFLLKRVVRKCIYEISAKYRSDGGILKVESKKEAKNFLRVNLDKGIIDAKEVKDLFDIDPSDTKKYVIWLAKQYIGSNKSLSFDEMRSYIGEYNAFNGRNVKHKDINEYSTFKELKDDVDRINDSGVNISSSDLERDFEVVVDSDDLYIAVPHTHEASRKLGLSTFSFRDCKGGGKDSAWCVTYKAPDHFNDYYYNKGYTLYYVLIKNKDLLNSVIKKIPKRGKSLVVSAITVDKTGKNFEVYDGQDSLLNAEDTRRFLEILGIS